ncbi:MAG: hypothetical protein ABW046_05965 [Actinoplanes sp.]
MEPVTVTSSVRRTVRMAVALVIGQALLCALIGWLTLGSSQDQTRRPASPPVDQLAAPPPPALLEPTATISTAPRQIRPVRPIRPASSSPVARLDRTTRPTTPAPRPSSKRPPSRPPLPSTNPTPPAPPVPPGLLTPSPQPSSSATPIGLPGDEPVQQAVTIGDRCRPEGAYGRTKRGVLARCLSSWHRGPRWKIA